MSREKAEFKILWLSFLMATASFIYSSVDFYEKRNVKYELTVLSSKTSSTIDSPSFTSEFLITNTGNRAIFVLDSWLTLEMDEEYIKSLPESKSKSYNFITYAKKVNSSNFSRAPSIWTTLGLEPGESKVVSVQGDRKFGLMDFYRLMPRKTEELDSVLKELVKLSEITNATVVKSQTELRTLEQQVDSRYLTLYLNLKLQVNNDEVVYIKWPYDYVVTYQKKPNDPQTSQIQIMSFYHRITPAAKIDIKNEGKPMLNPIEID